MTEKGLKIVCIVFILFGAFVPAQAEKPLLQEGVIFPGEGVDDIRIGGPVSRKWPCGGSGDLQIKCLGDRVSEITIRSPYFYIIRSRLKVGREMADVLRFYGEGEMAVDSKVVDKIRIRYPGQGIDFEIGKSNKQITGIIIYRPTLPKSLK